MVNRSDYMWGKFGQRPNNTHVKEFVDPVQFYKSLDSDKYDLRSVVIISDSRVEVQYQHEVEDDSVSPNLNIFVAACFSTCWARFRLYEALELLGERVLYFDTDSGIYVKRRGLPDPSSEISSETLPVKWTVTTTLCVEFVLGGTKNYGYKTMT